MIKVFTILSKYFGYDSFREHQQEAIERVMNGGDCLVLMPTGGGKSLCYQVPALAMEGTAVVVSPLISLMKDQVEALRSNGIPAATYNSMLSAEEQYEVRRMSYGGILKLIYVSPEKLLAEMDSFFSHLKLSLFAIDEAHCISQWGHDFREEYTQLHILHEIFPQTPIMALTATADKITRKDIVSQLHLRVDDGDGIFVSSFDRPNLRLSVCKGFTKQRKESYIIQFIRRRHDSPGIVYCMSRKTTEALARHLQRNGISALPYHAGLTPQERGSTQDRFRNDMVQVVCATIAFGMGIDKSNIRWVIHYNLPKSIESFYQEIGRAGRDGAPAETVLFYSLQDVAQMTNLLMNGSDEGQRHVNMDKLHRMQQYAESTVCRRRILLNYFNELSDHDCHNCDVCAHPPVRRDGTIEAQKLLSAAVRTNCHASAHTLVDILTATPSSTIRHNGYDHLRTYGVGKDHPTHIWNDYLLQMLQMGYIEIEYDHWNAVSVTPLGWEVLRGIRRVELCDTIEEEKTKTKGGRQRQLHVEIPFLSTDEDTDRQLHDQLKQLRMRIARSEQVPAFVVFNDKVLQLLVMHKPTTVEQFGQISGIGEHKKERYGAIFAETIKAFLESRK
jgi:ATP-dependent DNA helicase RecQ